MTIKLNIDIPESDKQLVEFVIEHKDIAIEALKDAMGSFRKKDEFHYKKKDPRKHSRIIEYVDDDGEDLSDVKPYSHIKDSAKYIHDLRRQRNF